MEKENSGMITFGRQRSPEMTPEKKNNTTTSEFVIKEMLAL